MGHEGNMYLCNYIVSIDRTRTCDNSLYMIVKGSDKAETNINGCLHCVVRSRNSCYCRFFITPFV